MGADEAAAPGAGGASGTCHVDEEEAAAPGAGGGTGTCPVDEEEAAAPVEAMADSCVGARSVGATGVTSAPRATCCPSYAVGMPWRKRRHEKWYNSAGV